MRREIRPMTVPEIEKWYAEELAEAFAPAERKPLADILGINQQVVVTTFQLGDGFTNYLFPTAGALMAGLELGGVTYQQWVKFSWKIITLLVALGAVFSLVAQAIGLS